MGDDFYDFDRNDFEHFDEDAYSTKGTYHKKTDWSKLTPNVPDEVLAKFPFKVSKFATRKVVYDVDQATNKFFCAPVERQIIHGVTISDTTDLFFEYSKKDLWAEDEEDCRLIERMVKVQPVIQIEEKLSGVDKDASMCDYAILKDESIEKLVVLNPSPGTVTRVFKATGRKKATLQVEFAYTRAYKKTEYYSDALRRHDGVVMNNIKNIANVQDKVLYIGFNGNSLHNYVSKEYSLLYKNVIGWAFNPTSSFSIPYVNHFSRDGIGVNFTYTRKNYSATEYFPVISEYYRYSSAACIDYIAEKNGYSINKDMYLLVSKKYIPDMHRGFCPNSELSRDIGSVVAPVINVEEYEIVNDPVFGKTKVFVGKIYGGLKLKPPFTKDRGPLDSDLPFSYSDRTKYLTRLTRCKSVGNAEHCVSIPIGGNPIYVSNRFSALAEEDKGVVISEEDYDSRVYVQEVYYEHIFHTFNCNGKSIICDGSEFPISREDVFVSRVGKTYYVYTKNDLGRGKETICRRGPSVTPNCPNNGSESLYDGNSLHHLAPGSREKIYMQRSTPFPFHYGDFIYRQSGAVDMGVFNYS